MAIDKVKGYFKKYAMEDRFLEFDQPTETVEPATQGLHCEPKRIAKTLSFYGVSRVILLVTAGDAKIDNQKFRQQFGIKAKILAFEEVEPRIGHSVGGVCPFAVNDGVDVYLDISLKRFDSVYPAGGSANSAINLTLAELEYHSGSLQYVDVCKGWT